MDTDVKREDQIDERAAARAAGQDLSNGENQAADGFDDIANNYDKTADPTGENVNIDAARNAEMGAGGHAVNLSPGGRAGASKGGNKFAKISKRGGPMGIIVGMLVGGGFGMSVMFSPAIMLVHMKELLVEKFDYQSVSREHRYNRIILSKLTGSTGATKGVCGKIPLACKYERMSNDMLKKMDANRIQSFSDADGKTPTKKSGTFGERPTSFRYVDLNGNVGEPISAKDFSAVLRRNPEMRAAFKNSFSPRYTGFSDSIFANIMGRFKLSKANPFKSEDPKKLDGELKGNLKEGAKKPGVTFAEGEPNKDDPDKRTQSEIDADKVNGDIPEDVMPEDAMKKTIADKLKAGGKGGIVAMVASLYCSATQISKDLGKATRAIQMAQLARYGMLFLNMADQIKAGKAKPGQVSFLATKLTTVLKNKNGDTTKHSWSDGKGVGWGLFRENRTPKSTSTWQRFVPGGGWSKLLTEFSNKIGGNNSSVKKMCDAVNSTAGQVIMSVAGGWTGIVSLVGGILIDKSGVIDAVLGALMGKLTGALAGQVVSEFDVGENAGDAAVSGINNMFSETAAAGGNGGLSLGDAKTYALAQKEVNIAYAEEDRATLSPFDMNSTHTMMGSIANSLLPLYNAGDLTTTANVLSGLIANTASIFTGTAKAFNQASYEEALQQCDYKPITDSGTAAGPFCDMVRGVPVQYLDSDPVAVLQALEHQFEPETGEIRTDWPLDVRWIPLPDGGKLPLHTPLYIWQQECMSGKEPDEEIDGHIAGVMQDPAVKQAPVSVAEFCRIDRPGEANLAMFVIDLRLQRTMDGEEKIGGVGGGGQNPNDTGNPGMVTGDAQTLAKKIVASKNYGVDGKYQSQIANIAAGKAGCQVDIKILQTLATLVDKFKIQISSLNRFCTHTLTASGTGSLHYAGGGGHAVDISMVNGVASSGSKPNDLALINAMLAMQPPGQKIELGQKNCGNQQITIPSGVTVKRVSDSCNHIHIGFY